MQFYIFAGLMFVVNGGVYAVTAPMWGFVCDKKWPPILVTSLGSMFIILAFLFMGPVPFIPLETSLGLCIAMLVIHGVGFAAQLVAGFASAHRQALQNGFDDNLNTYAIVSGLWTATFALGAFIGPSIAGVLMDYYSFSVASLFVVASQVSIFILTLVFIYYKQRQLHIKGILFTISVFSCQEQSERSDYNPTNVRSKNVQNGAQIGNLAAIKKLSFGHDYTQVKCPVQNWPKRCIKWQFGC